MAVELFNARAFKPHRLHSVDRSWPETNCYVDLWIEILASLDMMPEACFGFAITQDFGADQFTFPKPPLQDLELLYGLRIRELSLYESLEHHVVQHLRLTNLILLEVDAFYLPDTFATTYQQDHTKTTIAIDYVNLENHTCRYFHNAARAELSGNDYIGIFQLNPDYTRRRDIMFPYLEVVERPPTQISDDNLMQVATELLKTHFKRRPKSNPFETWRRTFDQHLDSLLSNPNSLHTYAFHFPRLAGSNFETFSNHIDWLFQGEVEQAVASCQAIARVTKTLQYRLARSVARRKMDHANDCFDLLELNYSKIVFELGQQLS